MKVPCNVVKDLLPLYIEGLSSEETNELVKEHIIECEECASVLEREKRETVDIKPDFLGVKSLQLVEQNIRRRKLKIVAFTILIMCAVMIIIFSHLTKPEYFSYEECGVTIYESTESGNMYVEFATGVTSYSVDEYMSESKRVVEIEAWTTAWDKMLKKEIPAIKLSKKSNDINAVYYVDYHKEDNMKLIYENNFNQSGGSILLARHILGGYFIIACIGILVSGGLWLIFRKKILKYIFFVPVSYVASHILLLNDFSSYSALRDFCFNIVTAVFVYGIIVLGISLVRQYRGDMAE